MDTQFLRDIVQQIRDSLNVSVTSDELEQLAVVISTFDRIEKSSSEISLKESQLDHYIETATELAMVIERVLRKTLESIEEHSFHGVEKQKKSEKHLLTLQQNLIDAQDKIQRYLDFLNLLEEMRIVVEIIKFEKTIKELKDEISKELHSLIENSQEMLKEMENLYEVIAEPVIPEVEAEQVQIAVVIQDAIGVLRKSSDISSRLMSAYNNELDRLSRNSPSDKEQQELLDEMKEELSSKLLGKQIPLKGDFEKDPDIVKHLVKDKHISIFRLFMLKRKIQHLKKLEQKMEKLASQIQELYSLFNSLGRFSDVDEKNALIEKIESLREQLKSLKSEYTNIEEELIKVGMLPEKELTHKEDKGVEPEVSKGVSDEPSRPGISTSAESKQPFDLSILDNEFASQAKTGPDIVSSTDVSITFSDGVVKSGATNKDLEKNNNEIGKSIEDSIQREDGKKDTPGKDIGKKDKPT